MAFGVTALALTACILLVLTVANRWDTVARFDLMPDLCPHALPLPIASGKIVAIRDGTTHRSRS